MATRGMPSRTIRTTFAVLAVALSCATSAQTHFGCANGVNNFYQCERQKEAQLLRQDPSLATRQGDRLLLNLDGGRVKLFVDKGPRSADDEGVVRYALSRAFPGTRFVEVSASLYEGSERYLVNRSTGEKTVVTGASLLSPDAQRFVVWSDDEAYMTPFVRILRIEGSALRVEFESTQLKHGWPQEVRWASNSEVVFKGFDGGDFRLSAHKEPARPSVRWRLTEVPVRRTAN